MPVAVSCKCGQRFSAQDHLYGKQVNCPACGGPIQIPSPAAPRPVATAAPASTAPAAVRQPVATPARTPSAQTGVRVACACGQAFLAPESMRGKSARCSSCGGTLSIPAAEMGGDLLSVDPLAMGHNPLSAPSRAPIHDPLAPKPALPKAAPPQAAANQPPWLWIGLGGGAAVVVLIVVVAVIFSSRGGNNVAQAPTIPGAPQVPGTIGSRPSAPPAPAPASSAPPAPATGTAPPPPPPSAPATFPTANSSNSGSAGTTTSTAGAAASANTSKRSAFRDGEPRSAFQEAPPAGGMGISFLPTATHSWHNDDRFRRRGILKVGDAETKYGHYSWMTQLLPFLGHQKEYDRINFNQGLFDGDNIEVGASVIPAFLNPLDNRQVWKGYPLQGLALTHFAGMSGVEDARNVVAASLPRSDPRAGVFGYDDVATSDQITDGTSQTIMVIGSGTIANPWIMGGGATIRGAREPYFDKVSGFGTRSLPQAGTLAVMADGSVRFVSASVEPSVFRSMCTIHGAESVDVERAAAPFLLDSIAK